ncbi:MAG: hypothetical protein LBJ14_05375 [Desulfarculales bacterium]|jgi:phage/plasmid primase-like uncharacterized protein|nr:hypothetical protein [Desulfarculales bacterium]
MIFNVSAKSRSEIFNNIASLESHAGTPFLAAKNIRPGMHTYTDEQGRNTYIPLVSDKDPKNPGEYSGVIMIDADGRKSISKDTELKGSYHAINLPPGKLPEAEATIIAVDFESASTLHDAIKEMGLEKINILAAFSHSNLLDVARNINRDRPEQKIIIASDNNVKIARHTGKNYALGWGEKAAKEAGGMNIYPAFPKEGLKVESKDSKSWRNFNDVANGYENGLEMVIARLQPVKQILVQARNLARDIKQEQEQKKQPVAENRPKARNKQRPGMELGR